MRYRLRTLLIVLAVGPPLIAFLWFFGPLVTLLIDAIARDRGWLSLAGIAPMLGLLGTWTGLALYLAINRG